MYKRQGLVLVHHLVIDGHVVGDGLAVVLVVQAVHLLEVGDGDLLHILAALDLGAVSSTHLDFTRDKDPSVVAVLASTNGETVSFLAVCGTEAVAKGIKAGDLVKAVSAVCGGKGGGKTDSAMGGGTDLLKVDDALATVDDFVAAKLG